MPLPPLHPMLVNFTAALVPVSVVSDVLARVLRRPSLHLVGWWTLLYAALITPFTALAGWWWLRSIGDMNHPGIVVHQWLGLAVATLLVPLVLWRGCIHRRNDAPSGAYLAFGAMVLMALVYQGHLGGTMSFGDSEVAAPTNRLPESAPPRSGAGASDDHPHGIQWRDHLDLP